MLTVFIYTLRESLARRMGLVMLALSVIIPAFYIYSLSIQPGPDGQFLVGIGRQLTPAQMYVRLSWNIQLTLAQNLWTFVAIFTAASLLSSYLQKGWADLLLTKGVARWEFLVARMAGCLALFLLLIFSVVAVPALYFSSRTGISARPFLLALAVLACNFLFLLSFMALASVFQPNVALLVIIGFMQFHFSTVLAERKQLVQFFQKPWLEPPLNFLYTILPRTREVNGIGTDLLNNQPVDSWGPFWWSAALAVLFLGLACYSLHRKAI